MQVRRQAQHQQGGRGSRTYRQRAAGEGAEQAAAHAYHGRPIQRSILIIINCYLYGTTHRKHFAGTRHGGTH